MVKIKSIIQSSKSTYSPIMRLASETCYLYLEKIIIPKRNIDSSEKILKMEKLTEQLDKFLQRKNEPEFQSFQEFFRDAETFLSPLCGLKEFKLSLLKLVPIYSYLSKVSEIIAE